MSNIEYVSSNQSYRSTYGQLTSLAFFLVFNHFSTASWADEPVLTVYTYDSFISEWGPGPAIESTFEAQCGCHLVFVGVTDGAALLSRLQFEGRYTDADVVVGLDQNLIPEARATDLFARHGLTPNFDLPVDWKDTHFLPFDWGWFSFVGRKGREMPTSLLELAASDQSIIIQDPRSSTPGLGLLLWIKRAYGDRSSAIWNDLVDNIVTVTPGWGEAYGLFLNGEADLVLSYTTSPAYHAIVESDESFVALRFREGHYIQIEVAAKIKLTDQSMLADQFMLFLLSGGFQSVIPTTNWMYPAITPSSGLPSYFDTLVIPTSTLIYAPEDLDNVKSLALAEWLDILSE
jgi:thiamine transport system substrate-binding protein